MKPVRVLIVEDSAFMRRIISDIINETPGLEVVATAKDGIDALKKIKDFKPDVLTMDLEMPRMDGIETMRHIMAENPLPVIMLSSHTSLGSESTLKALDAGAVDFITKPMRNTSEAFADSIEELKNVLPQKITAASTAKVNLIKPQKSAVDDGIKKAAPRIVRKEAAGVIVAIGASTGGPKALEVLFKNFSPDFSAAVMLSQHMPPGFTLSFAQRLDLLSPLKVKEAEQGDVLLKGQALVAPGGYHMVLHNKAVGLDSGPRVNYVRPSIDVMLESLVDCQHQVIVVMMTGMGKDGAEGTKVLKRKKKDTVVIIQDPATALIPSMPAALLKNGLSDIQVPVEKIAAEVERHTRLLSKQ